MPKRTDIKSILIIGSGPIVIGQACEFDYSGTQACKVLREEGYRVILVNSNPATIMTDPELADATYIEPITPDFVEKIIEKERPDAILPTMGGQTALNTAVALAERGVLEKYNVELIGAKLPAIKMAEDRELFLGAMKRAGLEMARGGFVRSIDEALAMLDEIGLPIIIRPSFTLGGTGGGTAYNREEFIERVEAGLQASPVKQVLIEESVIGWKEYELEVMRDLKDNVVIICSIENLDPMGVHTGDSITVAPALTLTDKEYQKMRDAALRIIREIGVETGGSNIQFALNPEDGRMLIIEMNPRVSRSSALASKATGFPIAKIAAKLAVGYTLDEIPNDITKKTPSSFEPSIDYIVVKIPRWDFEKFKGLDDSSSQLGIQMKSVGEAMAIGRTFKEAFQKCIRSMEQGRMGFGADGNDEFDIESASDEERDRIRTLVNARLHQRRSDMIFSIRTALALGMNTDEVSAITKIDPWFIDQMEQLVKMEEEIRSVKTLSYDLVWRAKRAGFSDRQLAFMTKKKEVEIRALRKKLGVIPVFKTVDTCAAEFEANTPYHYSTYEEETECIPSSRKKIMILGGGPNRIGQGIEFDYCCVHAAMALREDGFETIMVNCNPETVSTDYDTCDKLYFEPLTFEDVMSIIDAEQPDGVIISFGGQTPLKLAHALEQAGVKILGTSPEGIDLAEDRKRFGALLDKVKIPCPAYGTATNVDEAIVVAEKISYPVLVRPSYVLGGRAMEICYRRETLEEYMRKARGVSPKHPILIDRFLEEAFEFDVDALADGTGDVVIGGVMQHIEEAGIHSGDSSCVLPPYLIDDKAFNTIVDYSKRLARELKVIGLINIQYAMKDGEVMVLEVNPRASRTVPFVSKATGVQLAKVAARLMSGKKLKDMNLKDFSRTSKHISVKESVFPFAKFPRVRMFLGPEMRSTGEVMGIGNDFGTAILKAQIASSNPLPTKGAVFISVSDLDKKDRTIEVAKNFSALNFEIIATRGTASFLAAHGVPVSQILKVSEGRPHIVDAIKNGDIQLVVNTPSGETARVDEYAIGWAAVEHRVPFITTISAAASIVSGIKALRSGDVSVRSIQDVLAANAL